MIAAETNTKTETEVDISLIKIITAYCKDERKAQSHYWPMVEKALEMFDQGLEQKEIMRQFRVAFANANKVESKKYEQDPEYVTFRAMTSKIVNIAKCGREWYDKQRKDKVGFYRMYELCTKVNEETEPKVKPKPNNKKGNPKPAEPKVEPEEDEAKAEDEEELEPDALADKAWFTKCRQIVRQEPEAFIQMIAGLVENDELPEVILEPISQYLREEK